MLLNHRLDADRLALRTAKALKDRSSFEATVTDESFEQLRSTINYWLTPRRKIQVSDHALSILEDANEFLVEVAKRRGKRTSSSAPTNRYPQNAIRNNFGKHTSDSNLGSNSVSSTVAAPKRESLSKWKSTSKTVHTAESEFTATSSAEQIQVLLQDQKVFLYTRSSYSLSTHY